MAQKRVGGTLFLKINGEQRKAKGAFTVNIGQPKRDPVVGADVPHGYSEKPQISSIEGEITDSLDLDLTALLNLSEATVTLEHANGKVYALYDAWYAGDGNIGSEEGAVDVLFHADHGEEIR